MTYLDHRGQALSALDRARASREAIAREYLKPVNDRDYHRIADLRTAIRSDLLAAEVHAVLAPRVVVNVSNAFDATQAVRLLDAWTGDARADAALAEDLAREASICGNHDRPLPCLECA